MDQRIQQLFPRHQIVVNPSALLPQRFNDLLSLGSKVVRRQLCDIVGLDDASKSRQAIEDGNGVAVLLPTRKASAKQAPRLLIPITLKYAMQFILPDEPITDSQMPAAYLNVVGEFGLCQFTQFSGRFLDTRSISQLESVLPLPPGARRRVPFYDHCTGDFDIWADTVRPYWCYDHENGLSNYGLDSFGSWFNLKMSEACHLT
jgi:hypothetical protein